MSDWYARRFGGGQHQATTSTPPYTPPVQPSQHRTEPPAAHTQRPAPSSLQTSLCPACYSANYMAAPGTTYQRCYDCGYPVVQAGTGVSGVSSNASNSKVHKATQVEGSGFNPSVIIGRVE